MKTQSYSVFSCSDELLEPDGYGPLDHPSNARLSDALGSGLGYPPRLKSNVCIDNGVPTILNPLPGFFLFFEERFFDSDLDLFDGSPHSFEITFKHSDSFSYLGGHLRHDTDKDSAWVDFAGSSFCLAIGISVGGGNSPRLERSLIAASSLKQLQSHRTKQYPLRKFLPQELSLNLDAFPKAISFDGTTFFRNSWTDELTGKGWLGQEKSRTVCECKLVK